MVDNRKATWPDGLKRTKQRELVFSVLSSAEVPLSAADINITLLRNNTPVWLSTIYRILEQLVERGAAAEVMGGDMTLYELNTHTHRHFAVCMDCNKVLPMKNCPLGELENMLDEPGFRITGHNVEIFGYCAQCAPKPT